MTDSRSSDIGAEAAADDLMLALGQLLRRLRSEANPRELNLSQMGTLARLEQQGEATTADLARMEIMKPQSMKAILASLEEDGLVERRPHPTDGRQILFALTAAGTEERTRRTATKHEWLMSAFATLTHEEIQSLAAATELIKRLADA